MPLVTLSFDNGPHPGVTPMVLQTLARYGVAATFFVLGKNIETSEGRAVMAEAHARGHWIGNHTYHHETPLGLVEDAVASVQEIERTDALIGDYAPLSPLFRPYGQGGMLDHRLLSEAAVDHLVKRRATCVTWNAVPRDWVDPYGWVDTALRQIGEQEESLVVLHDTPTGAMVHLERFIEGALSSGAAFRQEFPEDCVLIWEGAPTASLDGYVARR
jgi:peptidoglycan/xylan/chitin deacetylase (PgdA/CDA1 family)